MNSSPTLNSTISSMSNLLQPSESVIAGLDGGETVTFERLEFAPFRGDMTSFEMFVELDSGFFLRRLGEFSVPISVIFEVEVVVAVAAVVVVIVDGQDEDAVYSIVDGV